MQLIEEGQLSFSFPDSWNVLKYDEPRGFYMTMLCKNFDSFKAIDILALDAQGRRLILIEIKDFRNHEIENRQRINLELANEFGQKVLHTLSGLFMAKWTRQTDFEPFVSPTVEHDSIEAVLFLEESIRKGPNKYGLEAQLKTRENLRVKLTSMFKPLQVKARLYNREDVPLKAGWTAA